MKTDAETTRPSKDSACLLRFAGLLLIAFVLSIAAPAVQPAGAQAGTYDDYSCAQPDGAAAPIDDWTPTASNLDMEIEDACGDGGPMWAAVIGDKAVPVGSEAQWAFLAPAGTIIREATLYRMFNNVDNEDTGNGFTFENLKAPYETSPPFERCGVSIAYHYSCSTTAGAFMGNFAPDMEVKVPSEDLRPERNGPAAGLYMSVGCGGGGGGSAEHCEGGTSGPIAFAEITSATVTLEDDSPPRVGVVGGSLTTGSELEGTQTLAITASDTGSGIYQAILEVDGKQVQATTIDNNNGHCENVGQTTDGRPAFLYVVPCKLEINDQYVTFNLTGIPDGPHKLTVLVTDAAGNKTTAFTREVIVGRGACNGTCLDQAQLAVSNPKMLKPVTRRYARSAIKLSGVLREPTGVPVPGATLELLQQAASIGAPTVPIATTTTNAAGQWTFDVPRGPSRALVVAWRSHALDPGYASQIEYHERVFADIGLAAPRRVRAGVPFTFRGKLIGGYIPREGDIVQMEILYLGRWRTIETVRSTRTGTFRYGYTFSQAGKGAYLFRASIRKNSTYPYLPTTSHPIRIKTH
jgi:hypothetical protein